MSYRNKNDYNGECASRGKKAEIKFENLALKNGFGFIKSSRNTDMYRKIDYFIRKCDNLGFFIENEPIISIDVKAAKKVNRSDYEPQYQLAWIELHGVNEGNRGWLYGGNADLIAFEDRDGFILVPREYLIDLVEKMVDKETRVKTASEAMYKVYQRAGRMDELTLIEKKYLLPIAWDVW